MADSGSSAHREPPSPTAQPGAKRRKIRKGTKSCWECKRRKHKCTWSGNEDKCDGCYHRETQCISQEFPEEHVPHVPHERRGVNNANRLQRLEALVEGLYQKLNSGTGTGTGTGTGPGGDRRVWSHKHGDGDGGGDSDGNVDSRSPARISPASAHSHSHVDVVDTNVPDNGMIRMTGALLPALAELSDKSVDPLIRALVAAWPSKDHHDVILNSDVGLLHPAHISACSGYRSPPQPRDLLKLPPVESRPVTIARKLLVLGTYLQVISSKSGNSVTDPGPEFHAVSSRAFETVSRLITHNDKLPESVEIIECLIIESQYHNYRGNIRRSWIALRRAMAMAQMLGLDRQNTPHHDMHRDATATTPYQDDIWFLLVHFDQYLSLMLGITPSLQENSQIRPGQLERYSPSERMGRLHSMAAGRILQRNRVNVHDMVETKEIDQILQLAADCMPAEWWLPPDDCSGEGAQSVIYRLMVQFAHYNILLQAHLPHMLHCLYNQQTHYYGTLTVINSSCELLTRFAGFRNRHPTVSYCRGLDIFAFIASTALCLLHIHINSVIQSLESHEGIGVSTLLRHQRTTHRGIMQRVLRSVEGMARAGLDDTIISDIVPAFRKLLAIEEEVHQGVAHSIHLPPDTRLPRSTSRGFVDDDGALLLEISFCGTYKLQRVNASTEIGRTGRAVQSEHILMGSYPPSAIDCLAPLPILRPSDDQHMLITETHDDGRQQSNVTSASSALPVFSAEFEEILNPMADTGFLEHLWDTQ